MREVSEAASSSSPLEVSTFSTSADTCCTNPARFWCISSIVIEAATEAIASMNRPWITSFSAMASCVRAPSVRAAVDTPSSVATTRTKNSVVMSIRILFLVISDCSPCRLISMGTAFMFATVMSWMIGITSAPPPMTTRSPPEPVRTKLWSLEEWR